MLIGIHPLLAPDLLHALEAMGHRLGRLGSQGDAHTIVVDPATGLVHGVADPRRRTSKAVSSAEDTSTTSRPMTSLRVRARNG